MTLQKKAFEIANAVLRVAAHSGNEAFKSYLESYAMLLMDGAARGHHGNAKQALQAIRQFIALGVVAGMLHRQDADLLDNEAKQMDAAIAEYGNQALPELGLAELFSKKDAANKAVAAVTATSDIHIPSGTPEEKKEDRQKKVLEKIRQSGNCRMKDLQDQLPNVSERTLRYDLKELVANGKIERFGTGGPSVYYSVRIAEIKETKPPLWQE